MRLPAIFNFQYRDAKPQAKPDRRYEHMRFIYILLFIGFLCIICLPINTRAQEEARAAWQVTNFDITVNNPGAERALNARATVSVRNVGLGSGATLTLRLNSKAEVKSVTVGGSSASYKSLPEPRGGAQRITITLPSAVAANQIGAVSIDCDRWRVFHGRLHRQPAGHL